MKKHIIGYVSVLVLAMGLSSFAGWMEKQADFWAEAAAKEFNLTPEQKQAVYDATIKRAERLVEVNILKDAGDAEGAQEKLQASATKYIEAVQEIVGVDRPGPIWEFNTRTHNAYKKLQAKK